MFAWITQSASDAWADVINNDTQSYSTEAIFQYNSGRNAQNKNFRRYITVQV